MEDWNYKIKNNEQFNNELARIWKKYYLNGNKYSKGEQMILDTLNEIKGFVFENIPYTNKEQYGYLLHFLEFEGGKEFLETTDGKDIIEVFFYFAYKWDSK